MNETSYSLKAINKQLIKKYVRFTYSALDREDMTVMFMRFQVLGDVGEVIHVVSILTRTEYVADLVLTDQLLKYSKSNHFLGLSNIF